MTKDGVASRLGKGKARQKEKAQVKRLLDEFHRFTTINQGGKNTKVIDVQKRFKRRGELGIRNDVRLRNSLL
jgi:hypothetical protein